MNLELVKIKILSNLGYGLSVYSLCKKLEITYEELCEVATKYPDVKLSLLKWYPTYDFEVKPLKTQEKPKETKSKSKK